MIAYGAGREIIFTLFRLLQMTEAKLVADEEWVRRDLEALKSLPEA